MRPYALLAPLLALPLAAQQPALPPTPAVPAGSNWQHLQALPAEATILVSAKTRHASCKFDKADDDTLTCTHGKPIVFQRADVKSIKIPRRGRSTLIAAGVGAGAGAIAGAAAFGCSTAQQKSFFGCFLEPTRPQGALLGGVVFGILGTPIGYFTDFARSTIYQAP